MGSTTAGTGITGSGNMATVPLLEVSMLEVGSAAEVFAIDSATVESSSCILMMMSASEGRLTTRR